MPSANTPLQALTYAKRFAGDTATDHADIKIRILNDASNRLWMFAPWRWTIGATPQITLKENTEDYTISAVSDAIYLVRSEIRYANKQQVTPLQVIHNATSQSQMKGSPRNIELTSTTNLRIRPRPSGIDLADPGVVYTWYKKNNVIIVESGAGAGQADDDNEGALLFPDEWFWVYQELVLYYAWKFSGDQRAGGVRTDSSGQSVYTGQLGECVDAMLQMSRKEKLFLDDIGQGVNG